MSKEIGGVLGKGHRCYLLGAAVLVVMSLSSYSDHSSITGIFFKRCPSEVMSALSTFLGNGYVHIYVSKSSELLETKEL